MEEKSKTKSRGDFWKQIGIIIIGTTISLVLTIGSSQFLEMRQRAKDRRLTAMMVLSNFESSAKAFEDMSKKMAYADSVGAWLLAQPIEKLELMPDDELQRLISDVTALKVFFHDETAEKIFSNNIDTWKNMGNFQFVDRVGQCFALVKTGENYWSDWVLEVDDVTKEIKAHTNDYEGKNYMI